MKKYLYYLGLSITAFAFVVCMNLMSSCEGPEGPAGLTGDTGLTGPEGPEGPEGQAGSDGTPGVAGTAECLVCHNLDKKTEVTTAYNASSHGIGATARYSAYGKNCATCHSHQGFTEKMVTGRDTTAASVPIPTAITCSTCHDFHETLDFESDGDDYALITKESVALRMYGDSVFIDFEGSGNLCANCHQPMSAGPDAANDSTKVTSTHYGPHHGPQSTILAGIGGYEIEGTVSYPDPADKTTHFTGGACAACHMHEGDHKWEPSLDACGVCHDGITDMDLGGKMTEIDGLLTTLAGKLTTAGLLDEGHPKVGTFGTDKVGALYNYLMVEDDRSDGIHNYKYSKALLQNSIEVFP